MSLKSLPHRPSLDHLKYQAKDLLKAGKARNPDAIARFQKMHPRIAQKAEPETQAARFRLSDAQLVIAREYGFESWFKLKRHIDSAIRPVNSEEEMASFFDAVRRLDIERVRRMLATNPEFVHARVLGDERLLGAIQARDTGTKQSNPDDPKSCTALHFAVRHGYDEPAKRLLTRGADSNIVRLRYDELAKTLLEHGADPNAIGWTGDEPCTPLELASWEGTLECVRMLLDRGVDPNRNARPRGQGSSALYSAAEHGRTAICELLVRYGAKPNIHSAAMLGLIDVLDKLLKSDPSLIQSRDLRQRTPLDAAVQFGQTEAAELLIQRGAVINLAEAAGLGMLDRVRQFVEANPTAVNPADQTETPLMAAARNGHLEVIRFLLDHGASVHLGQTEYIHTIRPIHVASASAVSLLAVAGADLNEPYRGYTPLQRAVSKGDWELMNALAANGGTKRFYLVGHLYEQLVEPLLNLGADVNEADEHGRTALDYAMENQKRLEPASPAESARFGMLAEALRRHGARG